MISITNSYIIIREQKHYGTMSDGDAYHNRCTHSSITDIEHSPNYTAFDLLQTHEVRK